MTHNCSPDCHIPYHITYHCARTLPKAHALHDEVLELTAVVALGVGTLVWGLTQKAQQLNSMTEYDASTASIVSELPPREDAVLVFGSTGKLGRQVVMQVWQVL